MMTSEIRLSNYQLKQLFEEFNKKLYEPGETPRFSWVIYKNCEILAPAYAKLMDSLFDERRDPDFPEFYKKQQELVQRYADRDEQNNIIRDENGSPQIDEYIVEFNQENEKLLQSYSTLYSKIKEKNKINTEIYNKVNTYTLYALELSEFPTRTAPYIVGILGY